jgi:hypothetical protein
MGTRSRRQRHAGGRHRRTHGTCEHQWIAAGAPCLRCGMVQRGRRPIRDRGELHGRGGSRDPYKSLEDATPECVPKPLRRSLLQRIAGLFQPKGKKS